MNASMRGVGAALEAGHGIFRHASWPPDHHGYLHGIKRVEQPAHQIAALRAREQELAALIAHVAQGDDTALATLYDQTSSLVYSLALRILREQAAAEDVTIEVYAQVHRQASTYDAKRGTPSAWLLTLTRSRAIDRLRQEGLRRQREEPMAEAAAVLSLSADPEECSTSTELRRLVRQALAMLTPEQREVIEIAYYAGLSHSEIAARLGQPLGTVKTRIRTGMMLLRDHFNMLLAKEQL